MTLQAFLNHFEVSIPSQIVWAHRVNNQAFLSKVIADDSIHMIEADIIRNKAGEIVMAHPPEESSDLSYEEFIQGILKTNKGMKLDFKDSSVVEECISLLRKSMVKSPVMLNSDILVGPGANSTKFDGAKFVQQCSNFSNGILSVGWTTKPVVGLSYSASMANKMNDLVKNYPSHVTFAFRICYVPDSLDTIHSLLSSKERSLTFWNNEPVSSNEEKWLKENTDASKCFYDILKIEKPL